MKHLRNKKTLLFGGILCLVAATIGVSVAYNQDRSTLENEFGVGQYRTVFTEQFTSPDNWKPCEEVPKTFTVKNEGDVDVKVRVKYDEVWRNAADTRNLSLTRSGVTLVNVVLQNTNDWELKSDGYYYYKNTLAPNDVTSSLFEKVVLDCNANFGKDNVCTETATGIQCTKPTDDYEGAVYHLKITAQTIEADVADTYWNLASGKVINQALKRLAGNNTATYNTANNNIQSIAIVDTLPSTIDLESSAKTNLAISGTDPIYAYDDGSHNIYIHADGRTLHAHNDCSHMFSGMRALTSLTLPSSFDTSSATDMSYMFSGMKALTSLTLPSSFDTSSVTNMSYMFSGGSTTFGGTPSKLTSLTLPSSFNTSSVTNMSNMFDELQSLTSLTLPSSFNTSSVTDMSYMFSGMRALTSLTLPSSFNTSSVTDMGGMFCGMSTLSSLTFSSNFDTSNVTRMGQMFMGARALTSLTLPSNFNTSSVTDMNSMFMSANALTSLTLPSSFDTSNVTNMSHMFHDAKALTSLTLPSSFNTSSATNMYSMFSGMTSLTSLTLPDGFDTSSVTDMKYMFSGMQALTSLTLPSSFVVESGTSTSNMFDNVPTTATLNSDADASVKTLWPGQLRS